MDNLKQARNNFAEVKDGDSQYAVPALYYFSHISYTEKSYQTALDGFLKLENGPGFGKVVPYYILQIYYLQGKYEQVAEYTLQNWRMQPLLTKKISITWLEMLITA
ncbi:MAG: hypothetical protein R2779_07890 [Crocinitomicaceae bacterium]